MPKWLEKKLEKQATKKHLPAKRKAAYVWGTMRRLGYGKGGKKSGKLKG